MKKVKVETWEVAGHYRKSVNEAKWVRFMTLDEAKALRSGQRVLVLSKDGRWANAKVNGAPKVWKTRPLDCTVSLKYGMYEYFTEEFISNNTTTRLIVEV